MDVGYGRVSTLAQDTALQEDAFRRAGVERIVTEKWSSIGARPALMRLLQELRPGDCVTVYKLDRLGRSLQDLLAILQRINDAGATFRSLTEPIDTNTAAGKLMYSILGAVAEFEKSLIGERVRAGQVAAYRRGVRFGRQRRFSRAEEREIFVCYLCGDRIIDLARRYACATATIHGIIDRELGIERRPRLPVLGPLLAVAK